MIIYYLSFDYLVYISYVYAYGANRIDVKKKIHNIAKFLDKSIFIVQIFVCRRRN